MADNPLFPGYKPRREGDSVNPLYPGYSEGQRPYKPPRGTPLGSYEYNADYWLEQIDQMSFDFGNIPKWFWERYENDFRDNLKAVYSPEAVPIEQLDDYDQDVFPGVSNISLTLDPWEWQDPKKVLESTAKSWIGAGTGLQFRKEGWGLQALPIDLTDYDTRVRTAMWKVALGLQKPQSKTGEIGAKAVASATRARAGEDTEGGSFFKFAEADYVVGPALGYESMAKKAVEAQRYIKTGPKRDSKHDDFAAAMVSAVNEELNGDYDFEVENTEGFEPAIKKEKDDKTGKETEVAETNGKGHQKYVKKIDDKTTKEIFKKEEVFVDSQGNETARTVFYETRMRTGVFEQLYDKSEDAENFRYAALILKQKEALASDMAHPVISGAISGPFGITSALMARKLGNKNEEKTMECIDTPGGTKTRLEVKMDLLKKDINYRIKSDGTIDQAVQKVRDIDPVSAEAMQKYADQYKEYLKKVKGALDSYDGNDTALLNKLSNIAVDGKSLTGGMLGNPSIHREFLRQIESDIILPGKITRVNSKFQIGSYLKDLEERAASGTNAAGETISQIFDKEGGQEYKGFFANHARIVGSRLEIDRGSYAIEEFYDAITQGKFMERYIWNRLYRKMIGYTPGELVKKGLNNIGHFGLMIDDDSISEKLKNSSLFSSVFGHKFKVKIDNDGGIFKGKGSVIKETFRGSKDLAAVETLGGILTNVTHLEDSDLIKLITGDVRLVNSAGKLNKAAEWVLDPKNLKVPPNQIKNLWGKVPGFWKKDEHYLRTVQEQLDNFRKWLDQNGKALGITVKDFGQMSDDDQKRMLALFHALNKENQFYGSLKITKEFSGALQRIGVGLNKLQDKIFGFALFQKTIRPLLQLKNVITEKISEYVAKILTVFAKKGIHALTGGATVVFDYLIEKVLKPVIRFVVRKVVDFGQNFVGALAQGNISKAMAQADKELVAVTKFAMYVVGVPLILIYILVYGLFGTVLSSISPIDPTKDNSGYGGPVGYVGFPQGENNVIKIEKDVVINGVTNPEAGIPNEDLPISVKYVLRFTTKVDIDTPVRFTDIVYRIYDFNGTTTTAIVKTFSQDTGYTYVAGQSFEIVLDLGTFDSSYSDSLIKNVFSVDTPEYNLQPADTVTYTKYFRIGQPPSSIDCFTFDGPSLTDALENAAMDAILEIEPKTGMFLNKLCANNDWVIEFDFNDPRGFCGWAGDAGIVLFGSGCSTSYYLKDGVLPYLLAHELAHKYRGLYNSSENIDDTISGLDGRTLPTYDLCCGCTNNTLSEDFSETVGNTVRINVFGNCSSLIIGMYPNPATRYEEFWNDFSEHRNFVQEVVYN